MPWPRDAVLRAKTDVDCFACGRSYAYLGSDPHPGVCSSCGQRGVSFAGRPTITATQVHDDVGSAGGVAEVVLADATDRDLRYYLTINDDDGGAEPAGERVARLTTVRLEETRLTPASEHWSTALLPAGLRERLATALDRPVTMRATTRTEEGIGR